MTSFPDTERTASFDAGSDTDPNLEWSIVLAHHRDPERVGRSVRLAPGDSLELGRASEAFGLSSMNDEHLSRKHLRLTVDARGNLQAVDDDSRNGSYLNGARIAMGRVSSGDVIGIGRLLLLAERVARCTPDEEVIDDDGHDDDAGASQAWTRCVRAADRVAQRNTPVLVWGPTGAGKDRLARRIHRRSGCRGEFVVLRCGSFGENAASVLLGEDGRSELEAARDGTLYLDGIDDAPEALQAALLELLEHGRLRRPDTGRTAQLTVRFIASAREDPRAVAGVRQDFLHRISGWVVPVPALRKRRSDVVRLMNVFARRYAGEGVGLHPELVFRLLRHPWPGNVRELEAVIERAVVERREESLITEFPELDDILVDAREPAAISTMSRAPRARQAWVVAASGRWFVTPEGEKQHLERRKILARLLGALVAARRDRPGERLTVADLLAAAWPEDRFVGTAGANRVYVALATLRKLGLRDVVVRTDGGYVIDPDARVQIIED
ncbi:MAG: sigma 54-interacting transcriptional regulator [Nannocystaceae bacterium]|nr:sigma 54-interacting transcriptional regulator [Nannocystaceae bacterium]